MELGKNNAYYEMNHFCFPIILKFLADMKESTCKPVRKASVPNCSFLFIPSVTNPAQGLITSPGPQDICSELLSLLIPDLYQLTLGCQVNVLRHLPGHVTSDLQNN